MNGGLHDIRLPAPPSLELPLVLLSIAAAGVLLWLLLHYHRKPERRARRELQRLRRAVVAANVEQRAAAHALAALLRRGQVASRHGGELQWSDFSARLAEARFAASPCSAEQLDALLDEADSWLESRR